MATRGSRPNSVCALPVLRGDATKARNQLGWKPAVGFEALVKMMVDHDMELARQERTLERAGHRVVARGKAHG